MFSAISNLIGSGTGVNSGELIADLLAATSQPKEAALRSRETQNQIQLSALASASSSLDTFAAALTDLLDGQAFAGDLVSSEPSLASVGFVDGQRPQGLPATLEITQLAAARRLVSSPIADGATSVGTGNMTITSSSGSFDISLLSGAESLADLAAAINDADSGVTATVLTDANGARLVFEGQEGAAETFTISGDFADYNYPPGASGLSLVSEAADALVKIDGIDLRYSSNQIENAIPGVTLSLVTAAPGTQISISGDQPTGTVSTLVTEFVDAYNQLRTALNDATAPGVLGGSGGPLAGDSGVRDMVRSLGRIGSTILVDNGPFQTLSSIGIKTNNDGTLSIDSVRLAEVLASDPDAVSNMLDPTNPDENSPGIAGALQSIRDRLQGDDGSLAVSQNRLEQIQENLVKAREDLAEDNERYEAQLTRTFANMDQQLVLLQATQSYLTQQIAIWNGTNN